MKALIGLRPVITHKGSEQAVFVMSALRDYDIVKKIGYIIGDNHGSNDTLCRSLETYLSNEDIEWDPVKHRIRCMGHVLNLAVQYFLFGDNTSNEVDEPNEVDGSDGSDESDGSGTDETEVQSGKKKKPRGKKGWRQMGPLGKLHNIAVFIRSSVPRFDDFESLAHRTLPLDNSTRWNSWHEMLSVAIEKESVIDEYCKKWFNKLKDDYLSPEDWTFLRAIAKFLQPFHRATLETEGDNATIDRLLWTMDILSKHYDSSLV